MTKRHTLWASLIIIGVVLLPSCISIGTLKRYSGKTLPDKETALIKRGSDLPSWSLDGWAIADEVATLLIGGLGHTWPRKEVRVLPGEHKMGLGWPHKSLTFEAEAGRVYAFFGEPIDETQLVGKGGESGTVIKGEKRYYTWMEDESGTVIAGEKPPPD